jgi:hypothetical protein
MAWHGMAGQGRAGQGRAGQGRAGQGRAGQGRAWHGTVCPPLLSLPVARCGSMWRCGRCGSCAGGGGGGGTRDGRPGGLAYVIGRNGDAPDEAHGGCSADEVSDPEDDEVGTGSAALLLVCVPWMHPLYTHPSSIVVSVQVVDVREWMRSMAERKRLKAGGAPGAGSSTSRSGGAWGPWQDVCPQGAGVECGSSCRVHRHVAPVSYPLLLSLPLIPTPTPIYTCMSVVRYPFAAPLPPSTRVCLLCGTRLLPPYPHLHVYVCCAVPVCCPRVQPRGRTLGAVGQVGQAAAVAGAAVWVAPVRVVGTLGRVEGVEGVARRAPTVAGRQTPGTITPRAVTRTLVDPCPGAGLSGTCGQTSRSCWT